MAQATYKNPSLEKAIKKLTGIDRVANISGDVCSLCNKEARKFKDPESEREYKISGMCQQCQDNFFES